MHYPAHLQKLIEVLKQLPGVGTKSAERFAFHMLNWTPEQLRRMGETIGVLHDKISSCSICGCLMEGTSCRFCQSAQRESTLLCVIASPRDLFAMERTGEYRGLYHILGGLLSPLEGRGPEALAIDRLVRRLETGQFQELVIALDSTLEGDATALYLKQTLARFGLKISRLAFGLPMGSSLDYVDGDTLSRAFSGRRQF